MVRIRLVPYVHLFLLACAVGVQGLAKAQDVSAPSPQPGTVVGTATDTNGGTIPNALVVIQGIAPGDRYTAQTNDYGFFQIAGVKAGISCRLSVSAKGFADWSLPSITLAPGQYLEVTGIRLAVTDTITVQAVVSTEAIATEQVHAETRQRAFGGVMPMFYAVYDPNPVPLSASLKFRLAFRTAIDPFSIGADVFLAGVKQANDSPRYGQGAQGYFKRAGADFTSGFTDIMVGGAVLPTVLHQDPRYFYQGTGSKKSRVLHALSGPLIAKGDNGHWQPNFSSVGGDLTSGALANTYYPSRNRGTAVVFSIALVDLAGTMTADVIQEFIPRNMGAKDKGH
jgi:Carboxypeptidase regulatory-like domain